MCVIIFSIVGRDREVSKGFYYYSPWSKRKICPNLKANFVSKTSEATPTKIGVHACYINRYLHEFFELILIDLIFSLPWTIAHGLKGKFGHF